MTVYTYGLSTDQGDIRQENQDSCLCIAGAAEGMPAALFVVADGMGGLSFGAQISQFIISCFEKWWREDFQQMVSAGRDSYEDLEELLEQEIWDINQDIRHFNTQAQCKAGSTLSVLLLYGNKYYIKNLGDSRIYLLRYNELKQLTQDQSLVAQMVREGKMTEEEARKSPEKNKLTMCVGMFQVPMCFSTRGVLLPGDCFLLCSDGLYNCVERNQIEEILNERELSSQEKADMLRHVIMLGGASDNVTAVVVAVTELERQLDFSD